MMNKLLRRFSSTDIIGGENNELEKNELILNKNQNVQHQQQPQQQQQQKLAQQQRKQQIHVSPSAPSSPTSSTKTISFTSMMTAAKDIISSTTSNVSLNNKLNRQPTLTREKAKIVFVIGESNIDWSRYFRGKKINDVEVRVEQADFKEINISSFTDVGTMVDILVDRNGNKMIKSFRPDFLLIRQHARNFDNDWRRILIGLKYGCIPSVNSLDSIYNFCDKPWVFSQLIQLQKKHGQEAFPLINQTYHPDYKEMIRSSFPSIVKVGHAHHGLGKIKVENLLDLQDVASIVSISGSYATTEPFIDSKCDIHIQKIGDNYKAYMRRSITGNWKVNNGSSMLEQIQMNDRYKFWIDEVSKMFGGLDICVVQVVVSLDQDKEYIIDVADSCLTLLGESQDSDRKQISDLIISKMIQLYNNSSNSSGSISTDNSSKFNTIISAPVSSISSSPLKNPTISQNDITNMSDNTSISRTTTPATSTHSFRTDSQNTISLINRPQSPNKHSHIPPPLPPPPVLSSTNQAAKRTQPPIPPQQNQITDMKQSTFNQQTSMLNKNTSNNTEDNEDTMNNLRRTFAGIFGNSDL